MRTFPMLTATLLLAACATPQERAAQAQREMEQNIAIYGPACSRLGYPINSDQWRSCILNLAARDEMQRYASYPPPYYGYWPRGYWGPYW